MLAAVIKGARDLSLADLPDPVPGPGQVLLRVSHVGICGSDLSYYRKGAVGAFVVQEPLVPGHEMSGVVEADPSGRFAPGTPVTLHPASVGTKLPGLDDRPNIWPGGRYLGSAATLPHTQGAMSTLFVARDDQVRVLPEGVSLRRAALAEPLAVGLHAITISGGVEGKRVLVSGAGPIGLLLAGACIAKGATVTVADILPQALERASALGAATTVHVGRQPMPSEAFDVVFEASGAPPALSPCVNAVVRGGIMVQVGMVPGGDQPFDMAPVVARELQVRGAFRFNDEIDEAIAMLRDTPSLEQVVTHEFSLDDVLPAFECAADAAVSSKVLVVVNPELG